MVGCLGIGSVGAEFHFNTAGKVPLAGPLGEGCEGVEGAVGGALASGGFDGKFLEAFGGNFLPGDFENLDELDVALRGERAFFGVFDFEGDLGRSGNGAGSERVSL